jgi:hypothetical protein
MISHFHSAMNQHDACGCEESQALEAIFDQLSDLDLSDNAARVKALERFDSSVAGIACVALIRRGSSQSQTLKSNALLRKACADGAATIKNLCDLIEQGARPDSLQMAALDARYTQHLLAALGALDNLKE